ncbi:MAG TPA: hypothetical protein VGC41_01785 [Kofleriaceae bacterium]
MKAVLAVLCATGCSFIGVRGPVGYGDQPAANPASVHCTDSDALPALDALGGAAALAVAGGGFIIEQTSSSGDLHNFTKYYAGPLVVASILYFISTSYGSTRVERCRAIKGDGVLEQ